MLNSRKLPERLLCDLGVALIAVIVAALVRNILLSSLEERIVWVTFYPAVMVAALYGSWIAGVLTTGISCLVAIYAWPLFGDHRFIKDYPDILGLIAFVVNCAMISAVAEVARLARMRAAEAQQHAEAANHAKSAFLANISHELRTPLNAILGFSRLLSTDSAIPSEQRGTLNIISRSGEHLLGLINDVLDMAKIEAGRISIDPAPFDLHAMMRDITSLMSQRTQAKGLRMSLVLPPDVPRFILTDASRLRQAVLNLVGNAVKFTRDGGVTLRLETGTADAQRRVRLAIEVQDTGRGIAPEEQQRIFEPFVQIKQESDQKGTGLGLTITRQIVELLGGTIAVRSEMGKGSVFRVELPVEQVDAAGLMPDGMGEMRIARLEPGQGEFRILVVEDQAENSILLRRLLEMAGFQVRVAENGAAGVEMFQSWSPHFIWMDWRMPVMDGLEATKRIRSLDGGRNVKIAVLSASVFQQDRDQVLAAGADDFVPKPFQFAQITDCMTKHLGVRFACDDTPVPQAADPGAELDRGALASLPAPLREGLADALVSLTPSRIAVAIAGVREIDPSLGRVLEHHAGRLQYTLILNALRPGGADASRKESTE